MPDIEAAKTTIHALNGKLIKGRNIEVSKKLFLENVRLMSTGTPMLTTGPFISKQVIKKSANVYGSSFIE